MRIFPACRGVLLALVLIAPATAQEVGADLADPCRDPSVAPAGSLDTVRAGLERGVCGMSRFVDRLFGGGHELVEAAGGNHGRAGLALRWDDLDGIGLDGRLRANLALPAFDRRLNAIIGRVSRDEFVTDETVDVGPLAGKFSDEADAAWFAGLGYGVHRGRSSRFDLGAGVKLDSPLNPHLNARYRRYFQPDEVLLLTLRSTAFWENHEGFGLTQAFDIDRALTPEHLLRWANSLRWSEETLGLRWRSRIALYHALDQRRALRYELFARGETDGRQPDLYGLRLTHRRSAWRDWFFIEAGATLFWAHGILPADRCHGCPGVSIGFEILFGEAYDQQLRGAGQALEPSAYDAQ
ncbi:MAG: hypothetical protein EPO25_06195 [Gammaproteobacteria bacterium]|nr:MAG: hypothetical protein EPO25_06195 [Gammaproteobacteria bacterium]